MYKAPIVLFCFGVFVAPVHSGDMPTLMYSAAERQAILQMRSGQAGATQPETIVRYSGVVQRSSGKNTVWMNAQAQSASDTAYQSSYDTTLKLQGKQLRVGDQLDTTSGEVKKLLPDEVIQKVLKN